jgi:hypothetical protein
VSLQYTPKASLCRLTTSAAVTCLLALGLAYPGQALAQDACNGSEPEPQSAYQPPFERLFRSTLQDGINEWTAKLLHEARYGTRYTERLDGGSRPTLRAPTRSEPVSPDSLARPVLAPKPIAKVSGLINTDTSRGISDPTTCSGVVLSTGEKTLD